MVSHKNLSSNTHFHYRFRGTPLIQAFNDKTRATLLEGFIAKHTSKKATATDNF